MSTFNQIPILSDLPNVEFPYKISEEKKDTSGFWYGFSRHQKDCLQINVVHRVYLNRSRNFFNETPEQTVARQVIQVLAYCGEEKVGYARFRLYAVEDGGLKHPGVWSSSSTQVEPVWQRKRVAASIYAHMKAFEFPLSPASVLSQSAQNMWHKFDPKLSFNIMRSKINSTSPLALPKIPDLKNEAERVEAHFAKIREPDFYEFANEQLFQLEDCCEAISLALSDLQQYYINPREALLKMIDRFQWCYCFSQIDVVEEPDVFGQNSLARSKLLRKCSPAVWRWQRLLKANILPIAQSMKNKYWDAWNAEQSKFKTECEDWLGLYHHDDFA